MVQCGLSLWYLSGWVPVPEVIYIAFDLRSKAQPRDTAPAVSEPTNRINPTISSIASVHSSSLTRTMPSRQDSGTSLPSRQDSGTSKSHCQSSSTTSSSAHSASTSDGLTPLTAANLAHHNCLHPRIPADPFDHTIPQSQPPYSNRYEKARNDEKNFDTTRYVQLDHFVPMQRPREQVEEGDCDSMAHMEAHEVGGR